MYNKRQILESVGELDLKDYAVKLMRKLQEIHTDLVATEFYYRSYLFKIEHMFGRKEFVIYGRFAVTSAALNPTTMDFHVMETWIEMITVKTWYVPGKM